MRAAALTWKQGLPAPPSRGRIMPSQKRRIDAENLFSEPDSDLIRLCENLLDLHENNWPAFREAIGEANATLSKHETGFVRGFLAACLDPIEAAP